MANLFSGLRGLFNHTQVKGEMPQVLIESIAINEQGGGYAQIYYNRDTGTVIRGRRPDGTQLTPLYGRPGGPEARR